MKIVIGVILLILSFTTYADPINKIVFFGDSLTDNGNLYKLVKFIPKSPPYYQGRFSNGPTWAEYLGDYYRDNKGIDYDIYALSGSTVVLRDPAKGNIFYTLDEEITRYLTPNLFKDKSNTLFALWMGANDYMDELDQDVNALTDDVVGWLGYEITRLITSPWKTLGAKNIMILDVPDLSRIPYALNADEKLRARWAEISRLNHLKLLEKIKKIQKTYPDVHLVYIDTYHIFNDILDHPDKYNQQYNKHLFNTTQACWLGGRTLHETASNDSKLLMRSHSLTAAYLVEKTQESGFTPCESPDDYVYWDSIHPSRATHQLFAEIIRLKLAESAILA